jgi:hypothetical protein
MCVHFTFSESFGVSFTFEHVTGNWLVRDTEFGWLGEPGRCPQEWKRHVFGRSHWQFFQ